MHARAAEVGEGVSDREEPITGVIHVDLYGTSAERNEWLLDEIAKVAYDSGDDTLVHAHHDGACEVSPHCCGPRSFMRRELISRMQEFDFSDDYHKEDPGPEGTGFYYAAIDRCIALLRGDISVWTDPPKGA